MGIADLIVYEDKHVTLYHADCLSPEALEFITPLHVEDKPWGTLITDPPYGIDYVGRASTKWKQAIANDHDITARETVLRAWHAQSGDEPAIVFGSWKMPKPEGTRMTLIWDKRGVGGMGPMDLPWKPTHEEIYVLGKGFTGKRDPGVLTGETICTWNTGPAARLHPNEKPVELMQRLIAKSPGVILDPFAGSGATLVAARNLGRQAIGFEIDDQHVQTIIERLSQTTLDVGTVGVS